MRLVTYSHPQSGGQPRAGLLQGDTVLDIGHLTDDRVPSSMAGILASWETNAPDLRMAAAEFAASHRDVATLPPEVAVPVWESSIGMPVPPPPTFRDFSAFEEHARIDFERRGKQLPDAWYERPIFYFGNAATLVGPGAEIKKPTGTRAFDFEAEIAAVIGVAGRDIPVESALGHIAGFSLLNDWSARDVQQAEVTVGLGPSKGKDFATAMGPWLVTPDGFGDRLRDGRLHLDLSIRVHGDTIATTRTGSMHWSFADLIAEASRGVELRPGDVIASGTVPRGCLFELGEDVHPWLEAGDEIEIEATDLGRLWNRVI